MKNNNKKMVNFQHHESSGFGGGVNRGGGGASAETPTTTRTQYGTSNLLLNSEYVSSSSSDSCSCAPGTNCLNQTVVVSSTTTGTPLQERPQFHRRNGQAFSTFTSLMIVLVATSLMLFLAHTFFTILYYGTYDFRRGTSGGNQQFEFERDETAELIETAFTQLTSGQEIRFKKEDICLEPYGRYDESSLQPGTSASSKGRKKKRCTFKWWLNDLQSSGRGGGGGLGGGGILLRFAFAEDSDFFGEGAAHFVAGGKLHLHCLPPEAPGCQLAVRPFRKSSYRFLLVVHQVEADTGRAYFALHSAAYPQQCIGLRPLTSSSSSSETNSNSTLEPFTGADHQLLYLDGVDFREVLIAQALFDEEAHHFLDFRRSEEQKKVLPADLPVMRALKEEEEKEKKKKKSGDDESEDDNRQKKKKTVHSSNYSKLPHTYNVGGRQWPSA